MTPFTAGSLTQRQADELNAAMRRLAALELMTVTAPLTKSTVAGCVNLSVSQEAGEFMAVIKARATVISPSGVPDTLYSWHRVGYDAASLTVPPPLDQNPPPFPTTVDPESLTDPDHGIYNLRRPLMRHVLGNSTNQFLGAVPPLRKDTIVRIRKCEDDPGFYETDSVGSQHGYYLGQFVTDVTGPGVTTVVKKYVSLVARDLLAYSDAQILPITDDTPPVGTSPPPAPTPGPGSGPGGG